LEILFTVIIIPFIPGILQAMNTPIEAFEEARAYLLICMLGNVFIIGFNVISSSLQGLGNSKAPMYFVGISCLLNVLLDFNGSGHTFILALFNTSKLF
jgi:Na+-driven multidrug efflux pump